MNNSQKIQKSFYNSANELFKNMGFLNVNPGERYDKKIKTKIGYFYVRVDTDNKNMFTVYGNFLENPKNATLFFSHWKQNYHTTSPVEIALKEIENFYTQILKTVN